jgi:hypothetical protein
MSDHIPTMGAVASRLEPPPKARAAIRGRVARWQAWRVQDARDHPDRHAWRGDLERLSALLRGAVLTGIEVSDDWTTAYGESGRSLSFDLTLPDGHLVHLDLAIGPVEATNGYAADDVAYEHDLGLEIATFEGGEWGPADPAQDFDCMAWPVVPAFERAFLEAQPDEDEDD